MPEPFILPGEIEDPIERAINRLNPGERVTKFVAIVEWEDAAGCRQLQAVLGMDTAPWDAAGLLHHAIGSGCYLPTEEIDED